MKTKEIIAEEAAEKIDAKYEDDFWPNDVKEVAQIILAALNELEAQIKDSSVSQPSVDSVVNEQTGLALCPFCGNEPQFVMGFHEGVPFHQIKCLSDCPIRPKTKSSAESRDVTGDWNKRADAGTVEKTKTIRPATTDSKTREQTDDTLADKFERSIIVWTTEERPLIAALSEMTDTWIEDLNYCQQTVIDLRDACYSLLAELDQFPARSPRDAKENQNQ